MNNGLEVLFLNFVSIAYRMFLLSLAAILKQRIGLFIIITLSLIFYSCVDQYSQGKRIYVTLCSNCHGLDGTGLKKLIPSIRDSKIIADPQKLVCVIKNGINADSLDTRLSVMPSNKKIKGAELANLLNFINTEFRKQSTYYKISEVENWMKSCK